MTRAVYRVNGIVLKKRNVGEADRILTVFTKEYGKLRLLAKGIRRITSRRAGHLEVFTHVSLLVHRGRTLDSISEAQSRSSFHLLRKNLGGVSLAYYLCELVDSLLPERQEHTDVYELLLATMQAVNGGEWSEQTGVLFANTLCVSLGFLPRRRWLQKEEMNSFIERIIEKRLRTPKLLHRFA